jgi:hypothetical protein
MGIYCSNELHTIDSDDLVVNELESSILSKEVLQEVETIAAEERRVEEKVIWKQRLIQLNSNKIFKVPFHCVTESWAFFMLNNNIIEVDVQGVQFMKCVMFHYFENSSSFQSSTKFQKGFVTYNPKHGITSMQKHVTNEHILDLHKYLLHKNFNVKSKDGGKLKKMQAESIYHTYNQHEFFWKCEAL